MINIIIDNDKSPKKKINLNFPASSGCLIFQPPNVAGSASEVARSVTEGAAVY